MIVDTKNYRYMYKCNDYPQIVRIPINLLDTTAALDPENWELCAAYMDPERWEVFTRNGRYSIYAGEID